jgi:hypothetical protein
LAAGWWPVGTENDGSKLSVPSDKVISKETALSAAQEWVKQQPDQQPISHNPVTFQSNTLLSGYLQKNKIVPSYVNQFLSLYPIEYWQVEVKSSTGLNYLLDINMLTGKVEGWRKTSTNTAVSRREAIRIAESYLLSEHKELKGNYTVSGPDAKNPNRYVFTYPDVKIGEAVLSAVIEVKGREVASYHASFQVPNSHIAWLNKQDAASSQMGRLNLILTALMALAAIYYAIRLRKTTLFRRGLVLAAVFVAIYMLNNWNQFPAFQAMGYTQSPDPFSGHSAASILVILSNFFAIGMGIVAYLSITSGETLWQQYNSMPKTPRWRDSSFGRETLQSVGRGYGLAMFMLGLQALMLWIAQAGFGMWSVNDPSSSYYNLLNPLLFPLMAWAAAISEEAVYRLFGIALFARLFRNTFLAVLVPSLIWAFNHTLYPIYPVYTRLIEVTLLGLLFGYALLKYGFMTALFAHAIIDSTLMGLPLIGSAGLGATAAGVAYVTLPLLVAIILWLLHGLWFKGRASPLHPVMRE